MRFLHTMLRVGDLQRSIDFYTGVLGMQLLRRSENPEYKYSLAFVGFEANPTTGVPTSTSWARPTAILRWVYPTPTRPVNASRPLAATSPAKPAPSRAALR